MIDYENEDLGKFSKSMIKGFLKNVKLFSSVRSKQKFVNWCVENNCFEELAMIALVDYRHI